MGNKVLADNASNMKLMCIINIVICLSEIYKTNLVLKDAGIEICLRVNSAKIVR
jgi:hypothetical protein